MGEGVWNGPILLPMPADYNFIPEGTIVVVVLFHDSELDIDLGEMRQINM